MSSPEHAQSTARGSDWDTVPRYLAALFVVGLAISIPATMVASSIVASAVPFMMIGGVVTIGFPAAIAMQSKGWRGLHHAIAAGAILGLVPWGLWALVRGSPREAFEALAVGAAGGALGWLTVRAQLLLLRPVPGKWRTFASYGVAALVVWLSLVGARIAWAAIQGPPDMTCHNMFRFAESRSLSSVVTADLRLSENEWPKFRLVLKDIAAKDGWSLRDFPHPQSLGGSLCQESGTHITYRQWTWRDPPDATVNLMIVAPQGGEGWLQPTEGVFDRLEREWPGALTKKYSDPSISTRAVQ